MRFYKRLYVGSSVKKKRRQIVWKLKTGKVMPNVYCIALANNQDMLEIYHNAVLKQSYYRKYPPYIIGIAGSYQEAIELIQTMLMDTMELTGTYDVRKICVTLDWQKCN